MECVNLVRWMMSLLYGILSNGGMGVLEMYIVSCSCGGFLFFLVSDFINVGYCI